MIGLVIEAMANIVFLAIGRCVFRSASPTVSSRNTRLFVCDECHGAGDLLLHNKPLHAHGNVGRLRDRRNGMPQVTTNRGLIHRTANASAENRRARASSRHFMTGSLEVRYVVYSTTSQVTPFCLGMPLASKHRIPFSDSHSLLHRQSSVPEQRDSRPMHRVLALRPLQFPCRCV